MKKYLVAALAAATIVPVAAPAVASAAVITPGAISRIIAIQFTQTIQQRTAAAGSTLDSVKVRCKPTTAVGETYACVAYWMVEKQGTHIRARWRIAVGGPPAWRWHTVGPAQILRVW